jgi:WD40 repeat protein
MKTIRCFVSSPGDVGQERLIAQRVLNRLQGEFQQRVRLEPILWEHEPLRATSHFQSEIARPSNADIVVCILWSRLGTRLPEDFRRSDGTSYASGTEWEFEDAAQSFLQRGLPDLLVYRKTAPPVVAIHKEDELFARLQQKRALDAFVDRWFGNAQSGFKAAFHAFESPDEFERLLLTHLRRSLVDKIGAIAHQETGVAVATWHRGTPFRGLQAFDFEHSEIFFGRTQAIGQLRDKLIRQAGRGTPFVLIVSMSGGGKSSLMRAGLLPTLTQPGIVEGIGLWRWGTFRPRDAAHDILLSLSRAILSSTALPELGELGFSEVELAALLRQAPERAVQPIRAILSRAGQEVQKAENLRQAPGVRLVLGIDQLEEVFQTGSSSISADQSHLFVKAVDALVRSGDVWVVATMRSDMYGRLADFPEFLALKEGDGQFDLPSPALHEIEQMIVYPARVAGLQFETNPETSISLDRVLLESAMRDARALPLLEFTLDELYKGRSGDILTFEAYRRLGGLEGAIASRAEEVFQALPADVQGEFPHIAKGIVAVQDDHDLTTTSIRTLTTVLEKNHKSREFIRKFVDARLLVTDRQPNGQTTIGLAHEALLRHWPRLTNWIDQNREWLRIRGRVEKVAERWEAEHRSSDLLLAPGKPLAEAEALLAQAGDLPASVEEFISVSVNHVRSNQRKRRMRVLGTAGAFFAVLAIFGIYSFLGWQRTERLRAEVASQRDLAESNEIAAREQRIIAEKNERIAQEQRDVAKRETLAAEEARKRETAALAEEKLQRSAKETALMNNELLLAFRSVALAERDWQANDIKRARELLASLPVERRDWEWHYVNHLCNTEKLTIPHPGPVTKLAIAPQGAVALSVCSPEDNSPWCFIWDWDSGELLGSNRIGNSPPADAVLIEDGTQAISATTSEVLRWVVADANIVSRETFDTRAESVSISPRGTFLALAREVRGGGDDQDKQIAVEIRDLNNRSTVSEFSMVGSSVSELAFSRDESKLAIATGYGEVSLWEVNSGKLAYQFPKPAANTLNKTVFGIDVSETGDRVVVGRADGAVQMCRAEAGALWTSVGNHDSPVTSVCIDSAQKRVCSTSWDRSVGLWDLTQGRLITKFRGHEHWTVSARFSPSDQTLVSVGNDNHARVWSADRPVSTISSDSPNIAALQFTSNERQIIYGNLFGSDMQLSVSPIGASLLALNRFVGPRGANFIAVGPKNNLILTGGYESDKSHVIGLKGSNFGVERIWELKGHLEEVLSCVFSPDGRRIYTAGRDKTVRIWDANTQQEVQSFSDHKSGIKTLAINKDGTRLMVAESSGKVLVRNAASGAIQQTLHAVSGEPGDSLWAAALSPDGEQVATSAGPFGLSSRLQLWDVNSGQMARELVGHSGTVMCLNYHPGGRRLASGSRDQSIKVWDTRQGMETLTLRGHDSQVTTVVFSPSGHYLASGDWMGTIFLWDATPPKMHGT